MITVISPTYLRSIIQLSGDAIREFLAHADASQFKGEAHHAISAFHANPSDFTDDKLIAYGSDIITAIDHPVRIELRGKTPQGSAAQMVAKGIWGPKRTQAKSQINQKCQELGFSIFLKLAGTSSIEFNVPGVDKSLPIHYLQGAFEEVLQEMNYQPGEKINSLKTRIVIAADGDDTIYSGPRVGSLPTLADSPVKEPLLDYLRAGGVFMLVSGNDINRTFKRIIDTLTPEVYCRVLIAANGGAELVHINAKGHATPISNYKKHALDWAQALTPKHHLDMFYIGDDGSKEGNDYPAFKTVGFKHSVLVAKKFLSDYDPGLEPAYIGGLLQGTAKFMQDFLSSRIK